MKKMLNTMGAVCFVYWALGSIVHVMLPLGYSVKFGIAMLAWSTAYIFLCYRFKMNLYSHKLLWKVPEIVFLVAIPIMNIGTSVLRHFQGTDLSGVILGNLIN